jgi:hypothetical protein
VIPESADVVSPTEAPPALQVVASRPTKDGPTSTLSTGQGRKVLGRIDIRDPKIGTQGEKKTRRGRGKRKGKDTGASRDGTENVPPPPANQQNTLSRRRRARGTGYVDIGARPAPRRGRATNSVGGAETTNVANYLASQPVEALIEDVETTGRHTDVDKAWEHGRSRSDAGIRPKHRGRRRLPSQGDSRKKPEPTGRGFVPSELEDKGTAFKTADGLASDEDHRRSAASALSPRGETKLPEPTTETDVLVSTVQPLPSSTRRRAKEYFQRRTRERSVDEVGRHARPPHRHVSMVELEMRSSAPILRPQLDLKGSMENASTIANRPESIANGRRDQFVFDPEASPFTPNATSSPRQASLSSIGVQSFSSPTPLPSHGNRKVVPLVLPETSNRSNRVDTNHDSMIPITSHDITHGLAYTYAGANQTQARIQAEQIALMRLQAYYNWLAGSIPTTTGVGITFHESEHMETSGGGGGLSGGVALGRHTRIQGLGNQCRNANSAYAHPKEHVIFSPRDHERTEAGSQSVLQKGIVQSGKGESEKEPEGSCEGEARRKWDGKWRLREVGASGKEIGWSWGKGTSVELGPLKSLGG